MKRYIFWFAAGMTLGLAACAPTSTVPKGEPLPPTDAPKAIPLDAPETKAQRSPCSSLSTCAPVLHDVVVRNWRIPPMSAKARPKTTVLVDVKPDGYIRSMKVTQSSGNAAYDDSTIVAVQRSQPFVELRGLAEVQDRGGTQLQFVFVPR